MTVTSKKDVLNFFGKSASDGRAAFAFKDIPEGRYKLTLNSLDGRSYEPAFLEVSPPYSEAVFTSEEIVSKIDARELTFHVRNRSTGESLREFSVLIRVGPLWTTRVQSPGSGGLGDFGSIYPESSMSFVVAAPGYLPTFVDLASARIEADRMTLTVDLKPGWGAALVIFDAERLMGGLGVTFDDEVAPVQGLAGVQVFVRGQPVGVSDAAGLALITLDGPIDAKDLRLDGSTVLLLERFQNHTKTPDGIGFVFASRE